MRERLFSLWEGLRSSYWFLPGTMALGAVGLAFAVVTLDQRAGDGWIADVPWLFANRPDGARALLSTIAGSMITVAGVTFSVTIAAVAYVTSQFGPRILNTFMRDTGNQVTLGTFIATFIYCLLVLRTIQSPAESGGAAFVPQIAVLTGFAMALVSVAVLIFFIHHVPLSIHASHVVSQIGSDFVGKVDHVFPEPVASDDREDGRGPPPARPDDFEAASVVIRARHPGYVQYVDQDRLVDMALERDLLVEVRVRPGVFVRDGIPLARVYPGERVDEELEDAIRGTVHLGQRRTQTQDVVFLANELVEVAGRALSPGINDPFTAMTCLDWLGAGLSRMSRRPAPRPFRRDREGRVRVMVPLTDFAVLADEAFGRLRPYVEHDRNAALHMMEVLEQVAETVERSEDRRVVLSHADALLRGTERRLEDEADREAVRRFHRALAHGALVREEPSPADLPPRASADGPARVDAPSTGP